MPVRVDLNADVGESFGNYVIGDDDGLLAIVTSANIAAGFHAGDPSVLRRTIRQAHARGVSIGAHPSFPDLVGFGRREMRMTEWEVEDAVLYQIASVAGVAKAEGACLRHVKPHGALYNMAARDGNTAHAIARAIAAFDRRLFLFAPPSSALQSAATDIGLSVVLEGFADRRYDSTGHLVSRLLPGAVIDDPDEAANQALQLSAGRVTAADGSLVSLRVQSVCVHGDLPGAVRRAARVRAVLETAGITVSAPPAA
ncbi:MAG: LamB/YcsF family protein [Vicinamibacterales bacterium]